MTADGSPTSPSTAKLKLVNPPAARIPRGSERVNPALFQAILLDDLNLKMMRLIELLEAEHEEGMLYAAPALVLSQSIRYDLPTRLFSVSVANDGPGSLALYLNIRTLTPATIAANGVLSVSYRTAAIRRLWLDPLAGATPTVRISGTY